MNVIILINDGQRNLFSEKCFDNIFPYNNNMTVIIIKIYDGSRYLGTLDCLAGFYNPLMDHH